MLRKTSPLILATLLLAACGKHDAAAPTAAPAAAESAAAPAATGKLDVTGGKTREAAAGGNGAGFLSIANGTGADDVLLSATSPAAASVEIHEMKMDGDVMQMRALPDGLPVPAGQTVALAPGGTHLMLIGLKEALAAGASVPVTLKFKTAGDVAATLAVEAVAAEAAPAGEHAGHEGH